MLPMPKRPTAEFRIDRSRQMMPVSRRSFASSHIARILVLRRSPGDTHDVTAGMLRMIMLKIIYRETPLLQATPSSRLLPPAELIKRSIFSTAKYPAMFYLTFNQLLLYFLTSRVFTVYQ